MAMTDASSYQGHRRPRPARSLDTDFFWQGLDESRLLFQVCPSCEQVRHPPVACCPSCFETRVEYIESTRRGVVYSFTTHHHPPIPGFSAPFAIVVAELEEGVRLVAGLDGPAESLAIGDPVRVDFEKQPDGWSVPVFRRVG
jgi:uncharacterized OB-fold protein